MNVCVDIEYRYSMRKSSIISWSYTPYHLECLNKFGQQKECPTEDHIIQIFVDLSKLNKQVGS